MELEYKPDFDRCMERIEAWFEQEIVDRVPIRFHAHNAEYNHAPAQSERTWSSLKERWFDIDFQLEEFERSLAQQQWNAETFPVFWPNLGPEVFSAFYGSELIYQEVTSYSVQLLEEVDEFHKIRLDNKNEYFRTIEAMTQAALHQFAGKCLVGYTDLHPGMDCVAAWRDSQELCMDLITDPEEVKQLIDFSLKDFQMIYDHFDAMLKAARQLSVAWMAIPSFGKMHIPSCDFSSLISPQHFEEFCFPILQQEVKNMTHNVFHMDGKGVAKHVDSILQIPEIQAIQWVQGPAEDQPIMQWIPLIQKIQHAGKSVIVDLSMDELEPFIREVDREGIMIWIAAEEDQQQSIVERVKKW